MFIKYIENIQLFNVINFQLTSNKYKLNKEIN